MTVPPLEYRPDLDGSRIRKCWLFFIELFVAGAVLNAAPYWLVRADYVTIGFPFAFYWAGGYVYRRYFYASHLLADLILLLVISFLVAWRLVSRRQYIR